MYNLMKEKIDVKKINDNGRIHRLLLIILSFGFYIAFFFIDGYVLCADSNTYITMDFSREPLYSIYLAVFRKIFGGQSDFYLLMAVLGQCLLAGYSAYYLVRTVADEFKLPAYLQYIVLAFPLGASFLCRFAAKRGSMYSNSILTEGLTISLYLILVCASFQYILHGTKKSFWTSVLLCFLGLSCRKQMIVCLMIFMCGILFRHLKNDFLKGIIKCVVAVTIVLVASFLFDKGYNYMVRGEFERHVDDNRFVATMIFYTADREFAEYIENEEVRQVFLDVYDLCAEKEYLMNQSPKGWLNEVSHFGDNYDFIQLDTLCVYLDEHIADLEYRQDIEIDEVREDLVKSEIIRALLPHEVGRIIKVIWNNFLSGLVNTVAKRTPILCLYSAIAYAVYIGLFVFLCVCKRNKALLTFAGLTMASIVINVGVVSAVIFTQTRYVIYNMPFFYVAGVLMFYETVQYFRLKNKQ